MPWRKLNGKFFAMVKIDLVFEGPKLIRKLPQYC